MSWVNSGLMTFFFFVFGLEARREFDMGELRERRRLALPVLAGLGGLVLPVAIYLALNAGPSVGWRLGRGDVHGLGVRAGVAGPDRAAVPGPGPGVPASVAVVDDLVSLVVIGTVYTGLWRWPRSPRRSGSSR